MAKQTGYLWALVQEWLDADWNPPSQNKLARRLGVSSSALGDYKYAAHMPSPEFIERLAHEIQVPYERLLDAVLKDHGYRRPNPKELMGNAKHPAPNRKASRDAQRGSEQTREKIAKVTASKSKPDKPEPEEGEQTA